MKDIYQKWILFSFKLFNLEQAKLYRNYLEEVENKIGQTSLFC